MRREREHGRERERDRGRKMREKKKEEKGATFQLRSQHSQETKGNNKKLILKYLFG